ncbi:hypothetical protein HDV02_001704 [Globomyces sp. JEL0801]|nr:hypothetical protein HDV02_001704 [Globomyces sp. JEL0801]
MPMHQMLVVELDANLYLIKQQGTVVQYLLDYTTHPDLGEIAIRILLKSLPLSILKTVESANGLVLSTDTSKCAMGAVLKQYDSESELRAVACSKFYGSGTQILSL